MSITTEQTYSFKSLYNQIYFFVKQKEKLLEEITDTKVKFEIMYTVEALGLTTANLQLSQWLGLKPSFVYERLQKVHEVFRSVRTMIKDLSMSNADAQEEIEFHIDQITNLLNVITNQQVFNKYEVKDPIYEEIQNSFVLSV